jgi:formate-dependent phosphoribosylglycinamide formyltransferase (GAR transformylase)
MPISHAFVQVGAARDGLDPYLDCARSRGMPAVLVETPAYLAWRNRLGRRRFDFELAVDHPQNPDEVIARLGRAGVRAVFVLTGFERYVSSSFALARKLGVTPWPRYGSGFTPLDKAGQRTLLAAAAPHIRQPRYVAAATADPAATVAEAAWRSLRFPQVVKPSDGGGGLGIRLVGDAAGRARAFAHLRQAANYGGGRFAQIIVEEFVKGPEWSAQGVVLAGRPVLLSACEKIITLEPATGDVAAQTFRETGHLVYSGRLVPDRLRDMVQAAIAALGMAEGPFHVDAILADDDAVFIEAGFRLSGSGIVGLVEQATGVNWAEAVFRVHLAEPVGRPDSAAVAEPGSGMATATPSRPDGSPPAIVVGQVTAISPDELDRARSLASAQLQVRIVPFPPTPTLADIDVDPTSLAADLARHSGFAGRIVISGTDHGEVKRALECCVGTRLGA